jgi:dTDP-4-amino-4,6-dideoxygalactose transaminase
MSRGKAVNRKRIHLSPPTVGGEELALLGDAVTSNWIAPLGPHVDAFERELAARVGVAHAAALSSGTAALHLALEILGVGPGDEVYCSTLTFAASANAILYCGAAPVFVDSDRTTWNLDPELLSAAVDEAARRGKLPKAVVVVDAYGQCADYEPIASACARHDVPIVEDAAEALGATYRGRAAGSLGALGVFSFNGNKIITTSGGGMLVSDNAEWIARARHLATQARESTEDNHYLHIVVGHNYRMSNLLAALGRAQLRKLDGWIARRRSLFDRYRAALEDLPGLQFMPESPHGRSSRWLTCVLIDPEVFGADRRAVQVALEAANIESRPVWRPMHLQPVFRGARAIGGAVAESLYRQGLCLPSGSALSDEDQDRIIEIIRAVAGH